MTWTNPPSDPNGGTPTFWGRKENDSPFWKDGHLIGINFLRFFWGIFWDIPDGFQQLEDVGDLLGFERNVWFVNM